MFDARCWQQRYGGVMGARSATPTRLITRSDIRSMSVGAGSTRNSSMLWATAPPILNGPKTMLAPPPAAGPDTPIPRGCRPPRWRGERDGSIEAGRAVQESHIRPAAVAVYALRVSRCRRGLVRAEVWNVVGLAVPRMSAHVQMWAAAPHMHCMHRCAGAGRGSST